jgi:hypothetical protein
MPDTDRRAIAPREKPGHNLRRKRLAWLAASLIAMPLWLGGCAPIEPLPPPAVADTGPPAAAVEPATGPIALAPSITGTPAPAPGRAPAVVIPEPLPPIPAAAVAMPAPPPAPAPAAAIPAAAVESPAEPSPCPPGLIATWSKPDMAGMPVLLCRRAPPPR